MNLNEMRNMRPSMGNPPNDVAVQNANRIIESLGIEPFSLQPSVEEGILIRYAAGDIGAFVECYNDGEIGYTLTRLGKSVQSKDLCAQGANPFDFISDIRKHLGHSGSK